MEDSSMETPCLFLDHGLLLCNHNCIWVLITKHSQTMDHSCVSSGGTAASSHTMPQWKYSPKVQPNIRRRENNISNEFSELQNYRNKIQGSMSLHCWSSLHQTRQNQCQMEEELLLFLQRCKVEEVGEALSPASLLHYTVSIRVTKE